MEIVTDGTLPFIPESPAASVSPCDVGIAVDIGTTTVAVQVWSISKRAVLATTAEKNSQVRYGHDVIKRISFAQRKPPTGASSPSAFGMTALHYCIVGQLEKMFRAALAQAQATLPRGFQPKVRSIVVTGNTAMLNFLSAIPVNGLAQAPFTPMSHYDIETTWKLVRDGTFFDGHETLEEPAEDMKQAISASAIPDGTPTYFPPCVGAFIGADTVCAMIAAEFPIPGSSSNMRPESGSAPIMLADIGTNSEIVLFIADTPERKGRILCTATAAGPAFEASNISCGMSAIEGAIDKVRLEKGRIVVHTIRDAHAAGICGSGLVSAAAALFEHKYIDKNGVIQKAKSSLGDGSPCIELTPAVYISQQDIRNLQLAKSAVKTGITYLLEKSDETPVLHIAGGFGARLEIADALKISMIPPELAGNVVQIGNAALAGAAALIFSPTLRLKARALARKSVPINLAAVPEFQDNFLKSIDF